VRFGGWSDNGIISREWFEGWVGCWGGEGPRRRRAKYIHPRQPSRENVKTTWPTPVIPLALCIQFVFDYAEEDQECPKAARCRAVYVIHVKV